MLIEDLPRLSDEEREFTDDNYVVVPGVPNFGLDIADQRAAGVDVGKPYLAAKRLIFGFLARLRQRRKERLLARAQHWLAACQYAAENHPGLYDDIVRDAQLTVSKLKEANPQQK